jgi:hypothetical protein
MKKRSRKHFKEFSGLTLKCELMKKHIMIEVIIYFSKILIERMSITMHIFDEFLCKSLDNSMNIELDLHSYEPYELVWFMKVFLVNHITIDDEYQRAMI